METPELNTKRLILKPYTVSNITQEHVDWLNDPEVVRYSEQRRYTHTRENQRDYVSGMPLDGHLWLICVRVENTHTDVGGIMVPVRETVEIGTIGVRVDEHNKVGDMGVLIGRKDMWGKGYATEAWKAVMEFCFKVLELRKVECGTMNANIAMRKTAVKSGMEPEGIRLGHFLLDGEPQDLLLYGKKAK